MSLEDDEKWLAILAGRDSGDAADPGTKREAEALRRVILSRHGDDDSESPVLDDKGLDRLLFRLKRENLLDKQERRETLSRWWSVPAAAAAAVILAIMLPLTWQLTKTPEDDPAGTSEWTRMRGSVETQLILSENPKLIATGIVEELNRLGIEVKLDEFEGHWYVDAQLPVPPPEQLKAFLDSKGLSPGQTGRMVLEIYSEHR